MVIWASGVPRRRGVRIAAYLLLVVAIVSTGSNSGITSLAVGVSVAGVAAVARRRGLVPAVALASALALAGVGRSDVSASQRDELLRRSVELYASGGALGQGPVSTKARLEREQAPFVKEAHDDYLAALIERGVIGLLGLMLLLAGLAVRTVPLARGRLRSGFDAVVPRSHALMGALAGTFVGMFVYELLHVRHVWLLFAVVAAVSIWGARR